MAERMAAFRKKMREEDPERYQAYLAKQKLASQKRRDELKKELNKKNPSQSAKDQRDRDNKLSLARQKRYQKKLNDDGVAKKKGRPKAEKAQTRKELKDTREKNKMYKQKQRENLTPQKKAWIRKKDRERKQMKRLEANKKREDVTANVGAKTAMNCTAIARKALPKKADTYAEVLSRLVVNCTPRKRKAVQEKMRRRQLLCPEMATAIKEGARESNSKKILHNIAKKLIARSHKKRIVCKSLGVSRKLNCSPRKVKRQPKYDVKLVHLFYVREDVSRTMPSKRYATKAGPGYLMQMSVMAAHHKYKAEYPVQHISYSKFAELRPKNVRLLSLKYREYCSCIYCINVRYKLLSVSKVVTDKSKKKTHESDIMDMLLCPKNDNQRFHGIQCVNDMCIKCNDKTARLYNYYSFAEDTLKNTEITWITWKRSKNDKGKSQRKSGMILSN